MTLKASDYNLLCQRVEPAQELASGLLVASVIGTLQQYVVVDAGDFCDYKNGDVIYAREIEAEIAYQGKKYWVIQDENVLVSVQK